jgi:NAD(P)H-flavin reductase
LNEVKHGKVIIVAGGTGIYPFSDLIDLLYKNKKLAENINLKQ